MHNKRLMRKFFDTCEIYFEDVLISGNYYVERYIDFHCSVFAKPEKIFSLTFHTGSVCFDIITLITASIGTILLDSMDIDEVLDSLEENDMILFEDERYQWKGFCIVDNNGKFISKSNLEEATHFRIEQRKSDKHMREPLSEIRTKPIANKNLIIPYSGNAETTDGRGIRRKKSSRTDFIAEVFEIPLSEIKNVESVSAIVIADREITDRMFNGISIAYGDSKRIDLLDIISASYFTDGDEYPYRGNLSKNDPAVKVTSKVSLARELAIDPNGNKATELLILDAEIISKGKSELPELLSRKSLQNIAIAVNIDCENRDEILDLTNNAEVFACTKDFLKRNYYPQQNYNQIIKQLHSQIKNIIEQKFTTEILPSICSWEEYQKARNSLFLMRKHSWNGSEKEEFIIAAYSLMNLCATVVFPFAEIERYCNQSKSISRVLPPGQRLEELWRLADKLPDSLSGHAINVIEIIDRLLYDMEPLKYQLLKKHLYDSKHKQIAVIVPKAYYVEILSSDDTLLLDKVTIVTANQFDNTAEYDEIIVAGAFSGKRFDIFRSKASAKIITLLYDYEEKVYKYKEKLAQSFEIQLNQMVLGAGECSLIEDADMNNKVSISEGELSVYGKESVELDLYIEKINSFNILKYASVSLSGGGASTVEAVAVGTFITGEKVFFTKHYKAFIFDSIKGTVTETEIERLSAGDTLIFTKRDNFTKNIVDNIFDSLIESGGLDPNVQDAEFKSKYWKMILRDYMEKEHLSYKDISKQLSAYGCKRHAVTIKAWLSDDYHIIGPHDQEAFAQIADLTGDSDLKADYISFYESCRIVRKKRREILALVGQAIIDKLRGYKPSEGSLLTAVYDNVEELSIILELDTILVLDEPVNVSINHVNKPLTIEEG